MKKFLIILFGICYLLIMYLTGEAQDINLDRPVKAGELTLFPDISNENNFYFVSDKPHLAKNANGKPEFSFLRYVQNEASAAGQPDNNEGSGGGIVHALVSLEVTPDQLKDAQRELQRIKPNGVIQGPVVYRSGKFGIVSSFKDPQGGLSKQVVGLGNAPILDGQKAAVSIQLTKEGAKILWESFKTATPDISFTFEMEVGGYRSPKKALIEANFDQIYDHKAFNAGVASQFLAAEIKLAFDDLVKSGAIKVTQVGEDEKMDALITTAYNKIADMMFAPLNGSGSPSIGDLSAGAGQSGSLLDRATTMYQRNQQEARDLNREADARSTGSATTAPPSSHGPSADTAHSVAGDPRTGGTRQPYEPARGAGVSPPTQPDNGGTGTNNNNNNNNQRASAPAFAIVASFEMKRIHQQGTFRIDLNKSTADKINMRFDENIGDLTSFEGDASVFHQVNLDDALFIQRELTAFVDGMNAQDFGQFINFVNVRMKKTHEDGAITNQEVRIDRNNFNKEGNNFRMLYGWKGDNDRKKWMDYEYEAEWSFFGGQTVKVPLVKSTSGAINLAPPFQKRTVEFQADPANVTSNNIRLITVKLIYKLNGAEQTKLITLNPSKGQLSEKVDFMLPADSYAYQYEVNWKQNDNQTKALGRRNGEDAIVFVDNITN